MTLSGRYAEGQGLDIRFLAIGDEVRPGCKRNTQLVGRKMHPVNRSQYGLVEQATNNAGEHVLLRHMCMNDINLEKFSCNSFSH